MAISVDCMHGVRTLPISAGHSVDPDSVAFTGTGIVQQGDAFSEFVLMFVLVCSLWDVWRYLTICHMSLQDLNFEGGGGGFSMFLWPCFEGFTNWCATLNYAVMSVLGVHPVNSVPKCVPVCSPSHLPWRSIARSGFHSQVPLIIEIRASTNIIHLIGVRHCAPTGDGVFMMTNGNALDWLFLVFLAGPWAYWHVKCTEMWRRETMCLFLLLNWICGVTLIFLNPQRNSAAIEEALLSCACGDWLVVIWPNSLARPPVIKEGLLVLELLAGSPVKQTRTTSMVLIHTACPPIL